MIVNWVEKTCSLREAYQNSWVRPFSNPMWFPPSGYFFLSFSFLSPQLLNYCYVKQHFLTGDFYFGIVLKKAWELLKKVVVSNVLCIRSLGFLYLSRFPSWTAEQVLKLSMHAQEVQIPLACWKWKGEGREERWFWCLRMKNPMDFLYIFKGCILLYYVSLQLTIHIYALWTIGSVKKKSQELVPC